MEQHQKNIMRAIVLLLVIVAGFFVFRATSSNDTSPEYVLKKIGDKVILPENQSPRVARVDTAENLAELQSQPFFQNAEIGDSLVVYPDRVIVYRGSSDKIVTMGSVDPARSAELFASPITDATVGPDGVATTTPVDQTTTTPATVQQATAVTVEIRNGTAKAGLAKKYATDLLKITGVTVPTTGNAANTAYVNPVIVNTTGLVIPEIEKAIGTTSVKTLPTGESASTAQVLVILGSKNNI